MLRTLEPQILTPHQEASEYQAMDHDGVNRQFVDDLVAGRGDTSSESRGLSRDFVDRDVIDLGCGPGGIAIELCRRFEHVRVLAIDAEVEMLEIAKREIDMAGLLDQITLQQADACQMDDFEDAIADIVISNSLLHHLEKPERGLETAIRLLRPGGRLFVRDLYRPESADEVERLVSTYAGEENETAQQLFRQSLHASLTLAEIQEIAERFHSQGLGISSEHVQMTSDRHWTIDWFRNK